MPRFVLLEHHWNGVHWDFLVERNEVLASWAIDAPVVAGRPLPARALADHRRIYLDYEGPISRGRGEVHRIDGGTYEVIVWEPGRVILEIEGDQLAGVVELLRRSETGEAAGVDSEERWTFRLRGKVA